MTSSSGSRQVILERIRHATGNGSPNVDAGYAALPREYVRAGRLEQEKRLELMIERLREYDAEVVETTPDSLPDAIAAQLAASGRRTFIAPPGLPAEWVSAGFDWKIDHGLTTAEIEGTGGVVTGSF